MSKAIKVFRKEYDNFDAAGLLKEEVEIQNISSSRIKLAKLGGEFLNFTSCDFLGFSQDSEVKKQFKLACKDYALGSHSNRTMTGTSEIHKQLEFRISNFYDVDDCLVFPSGYHALMGLFDCLTKDLDAIFLDSNSQSSLIDGARLAYAEKFIFESNSVSDFEHQLKKSEKARFRVLALDSFNHTDGSNYKLDEVFKMARKYQCLTVLDDSLGLGLMGENGRGFKEYYNLEDNPDLITGNLAISFGGVSGGFVAGSSELINWLRQMSRTFQLGEPLSALNASVLEKSLELVENQETKLDKLRENMRYFDSLLLKYNWKSPRSHCPIKNIIIGEVVKTQKTIDYLFSQGIVVEGLCYPSVEQETARLRVKLSVSHKKVDMDNFFNHLNKCRDFLRKD